VTEEAAPADRGRGFPTLAIPEMPAIPGAFRVRLVLAFSAVVAIALLLVLAALPRLLDGYFLEQEKRSLETRTDIMAFLVQLQLTQSLGLDSPAPRPVIMPTDPPEASDSVRQALGDSGSGTVHELADLVAKSDVQVSIADAAAPDSPVYSLQVAPGAPADGQRRESLSQQKSFRIRDPFWSQFGVGAPERIVTVRLSDPYTFRAQTLETVVGVMLAAAGLALSVAVFASLVLADRLTTPIRRLTRASRELGEGNLDARVSAPETAAPEIGELATAFNRMAARLQESISFIRDDRDRSREFLADVSHELRTPLAALRTFNELLRDGAAADPPTRDEFLEQSRQQIDRLDWLATNLLELSKLDSGLVLLDLRPDDLRAMVEAAVQQAEPVAKRKGVELSWEAPEEPVRQRHDAQRMGQVLGNLVGNAVKFTPPGGRVNVALTKTEAGAQIEVTDTGVGIDPQELPRVFERFYRGSRAHEERGGGSGLGLAIAQSIVEMHGGRISISSAVGQGTRVTVSLPREIVVSSPAPTPT
jgi:signal transduction histidine kinase